MKHTLLIIFLFFSLFSYSQENCNNGIDDDGDGKTDLNDNDCICSNTAINSIIPNPSFEIHTICPTDFSELSIATPWIQATEATTDYFNTCGFIMPAIKDLGLQNFPDGDGIAGAYYLTDWNEYLGVPLTSPMTAGTNYQLTFNIAAFKMLLNGGADSNVDSLEPVNVTLYGCANSKNMPLNIVSSPNLADPTWIEIGHTTYTPISSWGEITISFTPSITINAIMLGPPPVLPKSYPSIMGGKDGDYPYFLYDNLLLNISESFGVNITQNGNFCDSNLVLTAALTKPVSNKKTFQWYQNGIAIIGATNNSYHIPSFVTSLGQYSVKLTDGSTCFISPKLTINNMTTGPNSTTIQPNCIVTTGSITITTPAAQYSFDDGITWRKSQTSGPLSPGTYFIRTKELQGECISEATKIIINSPPNIPKTPEVNIIQPISCVDPFGLIEITSLADGYSFDGGLTWSTKPNSGKLSVGNYIIKTKNAIGCESTEVTIKINTPTDFPNPPTISVIQPDCSNTKGKINITSTASEYSFNNGITWTTSEVSDFLNPGDYYVKIKNANGCVSEASKAVIIPFINFSTSPTSTKNQIFCTYENADLSNILISGNNIKWYNALTDGIPLDNSTQLQDAIIYYASQTINGCESKRIPVSIKIQDTKDPIADINQNFCVQQNPTIDSIKISGENIKWYNEVTAGINLPESTPLENAIIYYASQTISTCESDRIPVSINILGATTGDCINYVEELPFPKFFTPNNDGYNDTWTIDFAYLKPNTGIRIFDRYGKFIKELTVNTAWDGTYIGQDEPASDYWFTVKRINGAEFRGHFSLKR